MLCSNLATLSKNQTTIYIPLLKAAIIHKRPVHTIQINSIPKKMENKLSTHITNQPIIQHSYRNNSQY